MYSGLQYVLYLNMSHLIHAFRAPGFPDALKRKEPEERHEHFSG